MPEELYSCMKSFCITGEFGGICSVSVGSALNEPDIPPVEGIDFKKGLRTVAGKTGLYLRMLEKFAASNADTDKKLLSELEKGDLKSSGDYSTHCQGCCRQYRCGQTVRTVRSA
ncbi:MAG: hypothetical protein LRY51_12285 [Geovibrio sp.]|nr:hypothetical protein [Geovibrio sp.]